MPGIGGGGGPPTPGIGGGSGPPPTCKVHKTKTLHIHDKFILLPSKTKITRFTECL
jgi:hypothetical protein